MDPSASGPDGLWLGLFVAGVLSFTLGLGQWLWGAPRRGGAPDWWGRLDQPVPEPSPALATYAGSAVGAVPSGRAASGLTFDSGGGPADPRNPGPPPAYHGLLLEEGPNGAYWRELNECDCEHPGMLEAAACSRLYAGIGSSSGRRVAVAVVRA
jgi:hypothetical protein